MNPCPKLVPFIALLSFGIAACNKEKNEDLDKAREAMHESHGQLKIKGQWNELKGKLKQKYASLTDDDVVYQQGREDELYGRLEHRPGEMRAELDQILNEL